MVTTTPRYSTSRTGTSSNRVGIWVQGSSMAGRKNNAPTQAWTAVRNQGEYRAESRFRVIM